MRRIICRSVLIALVAICTSPQSLVAENVPKMDPWAAFYPGSWIIVQEVREYEGQSTTTIVRKKITSKKAGLAEVVKYTEDGSKMIEKEREFFEGHTPETLFMKERSALNSSHKVGSFHYKTRKVIYVPDKKFSLARGPLTVYITDDLKVPYRELVLCGDDIALPENVVRAVYVAPDRKTGKMVRYESQIVDFYWLLPVGRERIPCYIEETKVIDLFSSKKVAEVKRWLSDKVPGHVVKLEYRFDTPHGPGMIRQTVEKYHVVTFRSQSITLGGARISFEIPDHFRKMTRNELARTYPMEKEPTLGYSAENSNVSVVVQSKDPAILIFGLIDLKRFMEDLLPRSIPGLRWIKREVTEIEGRKFIFYEFTSTNVDSDVHTLKITTFHRGKIVSLDFNASTELFPEYEQLMRIWVNTVRVD